MWVGQCAPCHNHNTCLFHCFTCMVLFLERTMWIPNAPFCEAIKELQSSQWRCIFPVSGIIILSKMSNTWFITTSSVVSGSGPCPQWVTYQWLLFISLLLSPFSHWDIILTTPSRYLADAYHKVTVDISFIPATSWSNHHPLSYLPNPTPSTLARTI